VIICLHDSTVDRTTDGEGRPRSMTFEQLRALDAGYRFTTDGGATHPFRGTGVRIPTFREVLEAFPDFHYAIEIKQSDPPIIDAVIEILRETGADARVSVAAFADPVVLAFRDAAPDMLTALALGEIIAFTRLDDTTEAAYVPPGRLLQIPTHQGNLEVLTPELVARAHRLGMRVQVWTINDPDEMREVLDLGVDGVMTDDPERLLEIMGR
jgi:glycerophosphoryl diester phosphodiesterase